MKQERPTYPQLHVLARFFLIVYFFVIIIQLAHFTCLSCTGRYTYIFVTVRSRLSPYGKVTFG